MPQQLIVDSSALYPFPLLTFNGAELSTDYAAFGTKSLKVQAAQSQCAAHAPLGDRFKLGTGDFTVEGFARLSSLSSTTNYNIVHLGNGSANGLGILKNTSNQIQVFWGLSSLAPGPALTAGVAFHFAVTRASGTLRAFLNGTQFVTSATAYDFSTTPMLVLGAFTSFGNTNGFGGYLDGCIDEFRITNGVARYTSNFTPPAAAFPENSTDDPYWDKVESLIHFETLATAAGGKAFNSFNAQQAFAPTWPAMFKQMGADVRRVNRTDYGGRGRVSGTVKIKGTPDYAVRRRVVLLRDIDAVCVGETWSDPLTGAYQFDSLDLTQRYTALAYDYEHNYRAVVADNLTPELIA